MDVPSPNFVCVHTPYVTEYGNDVYNLQRKQRNTMAISAPTEASHPQGSEWQCLTRILTTPSGGNSRAGGHEIQAVTPHKFFDQVATTLEQCNKLRTESNINDECFDSVAISC